MKKGFLSSNLKRLTLRKFFRLLVDFFVTFDSSFYREQTNSLFALAFPRSHYILIGQELTYSPSPCFDPNEYLGLKPTTIIKSKFPFFHYLINSSGRMPRNSWDLQYLNFAPEAYDFEKSLLLHAHLFNRNFFNEIKSIESSNQWEKTFAAAEKTKTFRLTSSVAPKSINVEELSLVIKIDNCFETVIPKSQLLEVFDHLELNIHRQAHCHNETMSPENFEVQISTSGEIHILAHQPILLNIDYITQLFYSDFDDHQKRLHIERMLHQLSKRQSYLPALQSKLTSSFSMKVADLVRDLSQESRSKISTFKSEIVYGAKCKRILLISHEDSHTGAPIYLEQLAGQLQQAGYEIHILSLRPNFRDGNFSKQKFFHSYLEDYRNKADSRSEVMRSWLLTKTGVKALKKVFQKFNPDLILVNTLNSSDAVRVAQFLDVPSILYVHESWAYDPAWENQDPFALHVKDALEASHMVLFGSKSTQDHWEKSKLSINGLAIPSYRQVEVPAAKELNLIRTKARSRLNIDKETKVFLSVATFEPRKRIEDIVKAFNLLSDSNTHLILVGATNSSADHEIHKLVGDNTRITIISATRNLLEFYAAGDCFVFASIEETLPLVLQEAALYQLPRIISTYNGSEELIPTSDYAFLFPPKNYVELANQMKSFLKFPELANAMVIKSYELQGFFLKEGNRALIEAIESVMQVRASIFPTEWLNEKD